jgi:hypothetical protein
MIEKIGFIKNPLTVIGIFAAIAEVSGSIVLPLIAEQNQKLFMLFVMLFPCLLVILFFATLFSKHHVLYAPSDFRSDESFTNLFDSASNSDKILKLAREYDFISEKIPNVETKGIEPSNLPERRTYRAFNLLAEELSIAALSKEGEINFERQVSLKMDPELVFDAVGRTANKTLILEIKYNESGVINNQQVQLFLGRCSRAFKLISKSDLAKIEVILVYVLDKKAISKRIAIEQELNQFINYQDFHVGIRIFDMNELESLFENVINPPRNMDANEIMKNRIVGILAAGRPLTVDQIFEKLKGSSVEIAALADVQRAIGELATEGKIEHSLGSIESYTYAKK